MRLLYNEYYDNFIKTKIFIHKKLNNKIRLNTNYKYFLTEELNNYINNCFDDSLSFKESLYRIYYGIDVHPKCIYCNCLAKFEINCESLFKPYCNDKKCSLKYGVQKGKQTKLKKYGDENYNNKKQIKSTHQSKTNQEKQQIINKVKQTKLEKYGDENYVNSNKAKQTKLERYGDENYNNKEKIQQTCIERYGTSSTLSKNSSIRNNIKEANIKKYGYYFVNVDKAKQTKLERYGDENYNNKEKIQQTCIEKFGYNTIFKVPEISQRTGNSEIRKQKEYETKKKNKSFNISTTEDESYILLKEKYPDILRQYRSELYPFNCDFYIPSLDLYIECQYGQFHHKRPYIGNELDLKEVKQLKERADIIHKQNNVEISRYDVELETWTIRDVKKRNVAKQNNLNYIEFWNIEELKKWIYNNE